MNAELDIVIDAAREAGEIILKYYNADYEIRDKGYHNPVTTADNESVQGFVGTVPPTLFKTPIYAKGGFSAWNLTASTSSPANTTGLNSNFIYRELKTNKSLGVTGVR